MLDRAVWAQLVDWKERNHHPLVLKGLRQTGKTFIVKQFGKEKYKNTVYIDLRANKRVHSAFAGDFKKCADYYLNIMIKMLEDAIENKTIEDEDYNKQLNILRKYDIGKLLEIFEDASDKTLVNAERKLLFDSIAFEIISYI